jgi:hypothetical protein
LSPFSEYAPTASRFKPDCSPQSKVTHSLDWRAQHRSNGKVVSALGMPAEYMGLGLFSERGNLRSRQRWPLQLFAGCAIMWPSKPRPPFEIHIGLLKKPIYADANDWM